MRIIFLSDIHLKLRKNKEWEENRFRELFSTIKDQKADIVILGGDIYDVSAPSVEDVGLFYSCIEDLSKTSNIILISGNHETFRDTVNVYHYLPQLNYKYIENEVISINNYNLYFVSYTSIKDIINIEVDKSKTNILFSHFRSDCGQFIKQEVNVQSISKKFDYTFVGDIHSKYSPYDNVFYPSSPYGIHYEPYKDYGYYEIKLNKKISFEWKRLYLPSKILLNTTADNLNNNVDYFVEDLSLTNNLYKVNIQGTPYTETLNKLKECSSIDYFNIENSDESMNDIIDSGIEELKHSKYGTIDTLINLLRVSNNNFTEEQYTYLQGVLLNVEN